MVTTSRGHAVEDIIRYHEATMWLVTGRLGKVRDSCVIRTVLGD